MADEDAISVAAARCVLGTGTAEDAALIEDSDEPTPTLEQAAWVLLEHDLALIAAGVVGPEAGLRGILGEVCRPARLVPRPRYGRDSHDIDRFLSLIDDYDDMRRYEQRNGTIDRRREQTDSCAVQAAEAWLYRHAPGRAR